MEAVRMESFGFIREHLDIKILILYVLARLPGAVDRESLADVVFCDGGVDYFSFSECLSDLVSTGHIAYEDDAYQITDKGREDGAVMETSIPISVRDHADMAMIPVAERVSRESMICAGHKMTEDGCTVELAMSDGKGEVIRLSVLVGDERQARQMEKNFRRSAEEMYLKIVTLLTEK